MLDILEYQNPWTGDEVFHALNSYGAKGRQAYLTYLFYDVLFVLARTVPIIVVCAWSFKKAPEKVRPGIWIPLINVAVDLTESFLLTVLIKLFPSTYPCLGNLDSLCDSIEMGDIPRHHCDYFYFLVGRYLLCISFLVGR